MQIFWNVLIILLLCLGPRLMTFLCDRFRLLGMLGPVFLCYAAGFIMSLVIPDTSLAMTLSEVLVPVAIPLILFSADFLSVKRLAKPTLRSFALVIVSVFCVTVVAYFIFRHTVPEAYKYAGMLIGLYTGGTPNLMAIGVALGVADTNIVLANASDVVVGGVYFLLLISVMPRLCRRFLRPFTMDAKPVATEDGEHLSENMQTRFVPAKEPFSFRSILRRIPIVLLGVACLAVAAGLAILFTGELHVAVIMLVVTTLGIALSFVKKVREAPGSFTAGQYLILMFSFGIGLSFDFSILQKDSLLLFAMFAAAQFGSIFLHILLCRVAKIDADTALITSTAGIYGPAFIVPTANAMRNEMVILPGLICGILGYAIGNYLGIGTALLLRVIGG